MPPSKRPPWHAYLILLRPRRVVRALEAATRSGLVGRVPSLWQIELGVLRMWHRILFRPETIGTCSDYAVRDDPWARLLEYRGVRLPFLLREGSVRPWDLSGLIGTPDQLMRHLLGTHHDGHQFVYDLQILAMHPGALAELRERARRVVEHATPRTRWLRNLCVYERYHESLLEAVDGCLRDGFPLSTEVADDPDITFFAYLDWCARQPATPRATWRAWRAGSFRLAPEQAPSPSTRPAG